MAIILEREPYYAHTSKSGHRGSENDPRWSARLHPGLIAKSPPAHRRAGHITEC